MMIKEIEFFKIFCDICHTNIELELSAEVESSLNESKWKIIKKADITHHICDKCAEQMK